MTSEEERVKRFKKLRRNHLAKSLENKVFRQRKVDKEYKKKRQRIIEEDNSIDFHSD